MLAAAVALGACGSVRTELPISVPPGLALPPSVEPTTVTTLEEPPTEVILATPETSVSAYKSPGEKHPLAGGTLAVSYPRVGVRPPRGVAAAPEGLSWSVVNVRFCAGAQSALDGGVVDPGRFAVEVPGQGYLTPTADAPALTATPLVAGTSVAAGTCTEGSIAYLIGGEGHIESTTYDTGDGLLRWAT